MNSEPEQETVEVISINDNPTEKLTPETIEAAMQAWHEEITILWFRRRFGIELDDDTAAVAK